MEGIVLTNPSVVSIALSSSGLVLFGALLVLFGFALALVFMLRSSKNTYTLLIADLAIILCLLVAVIVLDLSGASGSFYTFETVRILSDSFSTHRWLLIQLPVLLTLSSIAILCTYQQHITESHSKPYRTIVQISTCVSFLAILLIAFESLL